MEKELTTFQVGQVLKESSSRVSLQGRFHGDDGDSILTFMVPKLTVPEVEKVLKAKAPVESILSNDVFATYCVDASFKLHFNLFPATPHEVARHSNEKLFFVRETPEMYERVTLPHMQALPTSRTQWLRNIIDGSAEADRVLVRTDDFVLAHNIGSESNSSAVHVLAIAADPSLRTMRDLRGDHLPLLRRLREVSLATLEGLYAGCRLHVVAFLHYYPSYEHLHVHFATPAACDVSTVLCGKAHLLDDVIDNLECDGSFYSKRSITMTLKASSPLLEPILSILN